MWRMKGFYPFFAVILLGILALVFVRPWMEANRVAYNGIVIGYVTHAEGSVRRIHLKDVDVVPIPTVKPYELHDGDRLQTSVQSKADFELEQSHLEIPAGTVIQLNLGDSRNAHAPIYITAIVGTPNFGGDDFSRHIYLIKYGKLFLLGKKPPLLPGMTIANTTQVEASEAVSEGKAKERGDESPILIPQTLSNEFIEAAIYAHQAKMQHCWQGSKGHGLPGKIEMTVSFEIQTAGNVQNVRIENSPAQHEKLVNCLAKLFAESTFHPFSGSPISQTFRIGFE